MFSRSSIHHLPLSVWRPPPPRHFWPHDTQNLFSRRYSATPPDQKPRSVDRDELFSATASAWDHVFDSIEEMPPLFSARHTRKHPQMSLPDSLADLSPKSDRSKRRQAMTAREVSAFEDMFNMIFNAVQQQQLHQNVDAKDGEPSSATTTTTTTSPNIGRGPRVDGSIDDLFGSLRRHSRKFKWTNESDELLDRKKEEMDLCDTDVQLIDWAAREVFGESKRYEEAALRALASTSSTKDPDSPTSTTTAAAPPKQLLQLQPATYPHLLAYLMRACRDKHRDAHLALAMFEHARRLSIPSYVFGCSTPAYNELIETRWRCFRDLRGVRDALEEMRVNGVPSDGRTRRLVEGARWEVGELKRGTHGMMLWEAENGFENEDETWGVLAKIEALVAAGSKGKKSSSASSSTDEHDVRRDKKSWDEWKGTIVNSHSHSHNDDGWEFDRWEESRDRFNAYPERSGYSREEDKLHM